VGVTRLDAPISVDRLRPGEEALWSQFLTQAANPTLFHDLGFLQYHPANRYNFHHLMVRQNDRLIGIVPGALVGDGPRPSFASPTGASLGGPVVSPGLSAERALQIVEALQRHAAAQDWHGIELTLPPPVYDPGTAGTISFALFCRGFQLQHRWLCHVVPLVDGPSECFERCFRKGQISAVRSARRRGVTVQERGRDGLEDFLEVFADTYERHDVAATHSADEIADLLERLPDRIRLYLAMLGDQPVAGLLVFFPTAKVAYTFYICGSTEHAAQNGNAVVIAELMTRLRQRGYDYLDFGPSASDFNFNAGVAFFKEGMGGQGQCRDRWHWLVDAQPMPGYEHGP
jgi:hypothetical protein